MRSVRACIVIAIAACAASTAERRPSGVGSGATGSARAGSAEAAPPSPDDSLPVEYHGIAFHRGDRVRVYSRSGNYKPNETGHPRTVAIDEGRTGVFVGGRLRDDHPELPPATLAVIRWDAQIWHEWAPDDVGGETVGPEVQLPSFVATIHPSYLVPIARQ